MTRLGFRHGSFGNVERFVTGGECFLGLRDGLATPTVARGARDLGLKSLPFAFRQICDDGPSRQFGAGLVFQLSLTRKAAVELIIETHVQSCHTGRTVKVCTNCNTNRNTNDSHLIERYSKLLREADPHRLDLVVELLEFVGGPGFFAQAEGGVDLLDAR